MPDNNLIYRVKANDFEFSFSQDELDSVDIIKKSGTDYHLIKDDQSVSAKLIESGMHGKKAKVEVEGETFEVEIKDELDQMLDKMGFSSASTKHISEIKAPMPGLVLEISVSVGQEVLEGERLLILEAMKMENSIMIHANAVIKKINVKKGQAVDKGQVLLELE